MSEITLPKLNLKALKPIEIPQTLPLSWETQEILTSPLPVWWEEIKKNPKIALGSIKKSMDILVAEKVILEENIPEKIEVLETPLQNEPNSPSLIDMWNNAPSKEILDFIKTEAQEDSKNQETKTQTLENPIVFQNYESGFKKQSGNVLKKIQNFRYTPKTRAGLLIWLVVLSFSGIALLMIFFPEKHSLSIYKASILETVGKTQEEVIPSEEIIPDEPIIPEEIIPDEPIIPEEIIPEKVTPDEVSQTNKEKSVKKQEQKEKLRQFILKKYTS